MGRRGASAVEFALITPMLMTLFGGVATYSWVFLQQATLVDAVTEAARRAAPTSIDPDRDETAESQLKEAARAELSASLARAGWEPEATTTSVDLVTQGASR